MQDALWSQGIRKRLHRKRRHEFQVDHGYRKWFKTQCELSGMRSINIEILMGHSIGISDSYYGITESELLNDYLRAANFLTINESLWSTISVNALNYLTSAKNEGIIKITMTFINKTIIQIITSAIVLKAKYCLLY